MYNRCINLKVRTKKGVKYFFCARRKAEIERNECQRCLYKEYKKVAKITQKTRIRAVSKKRKTVSKKTYNEVYERDKGVCRICGCNLIELHHIIYRSESKALIDEPSNCIMLCNKHHKLVHSNKKKYQPMLLEMLSTSKKTS